MIIQLSPCIPIITPKGKALAHFIIDEGVEHNIYWVCFLDDSGESWTFANPDVRAQKNVTMGRRNISPFYEPEDVAFQRRWMASPLRFNNEVQDEIDEDSC